MSKPLATHRSVRNPRAGVQSEESLLVSEGEHGMFTRHVCEPPVSSRCHTAMTRSRLAGEAFGKPHTIRDCVNHTGASLRRVVFAAIRPPVFTTINTSASWLLLRNHCEDFMRTRQPHIAQTVGRGGLKYAHVVHTQIGYICVGNSSVTSNRRGYGQSYSNT